MSERTIANRIKEFLVAFSGEVVFGISDGTVSILGLVLGGTAGGYPADAVVLAGATGRCASKAAYLVDRNFEKK